MAALRVSKHTRRRCKRPPLLLETYDVEEPGNEVAESDLVHVRGAQAGDVAGHDRGGIQANVLKDVLLCRLSPDQLASVLHKFNVDVIISQMRRCKVRQYL